jgi:hypothetical protein
MPDVVRLRQVLAIIEREAAAQDAGTRNAGRWDQRFWATSTGEMPNAVSCSTAFCFAGWVAHLDGMRFDWAKQYDGVWEAAYVVYPSGRSVSVSAYARQALGLDRYQAANLFQGGNSLADLRRVVEQIEAAAALSA